MAAATMLPDTLPDVVELERAVFGHEIICDAEDEQQGRCDRPADWRIVMSCCGGSGFMCDDHWQAYIGVPRGHRVFCCHFCQSTAFKAADLVADAQRL